MKFIRAVKAAPARAAASVSRWIAIAAYWAGDKLDSVSFKLAAAAAKLSAAADDIREGL